MKSQKWYDAMHARRGKGTNQYTKAKEQGVELKCSEETKQKISDWNKGKHHSDETRKKISESRKKFLAENPDRVPYLLNHSSKGRSYPEEYFKGIFDSHKIKYEEQFVVGSYHLDFAFSDKKIDFEVDGDQHYLDERIVESDKRRNEFLESLGWTVIRIKWSDYQKLTRSEKEKIIDNLLASIV